MYRNWIVISALALLILGCSPKSIEVHEEGPHLGLDADAAEIEGLMAENIELKSSYYTIQATNEVADTLAVGTRLFQWLENINANLPETQKISFSNLNSRRSIPSDDPVVYNAAIIRQKLTTLLNETAPEIHAVVTGVVPVPTTLPDMDMQEFLAQGRKLTSLYDLATRWVLMSNYREVLTTRQQFDVRGYQFLSNLPDVEEKLKGFTQLAPTLQDQIRRAMIQLCMNDSDWEDVDRRDCINKVGKTELKGKLFDYYKDIRSAGKRNYESFFKLDPMLTRDDLKWSKKNGVETLRFPFLTPTNLAIGNYLKSNVEDEYQLPNFKVEIDFVPKKKKNLSYLEFQSGASARAEKGKITMDAKEPITEVSSQMTIRHEFGHLLGFKDCYVEFYDEDVSAIVHYQLDPTDIMCSGTGRFKQSHYERLKDEYQK